MADAASNPICMLYVLQVETLMSSKALVLPVLIGQSVHQFILRSGWPDVTPDILKIYPEFALPRPVRDPLAGQALRGMFK